MFQRFNVFALSVCWSAYHRCIKLFFGCARQFSVTQILLELGLHSFDTILNSQYSFNQLWHKCGNAFLRILSK